MPAPGWYPDPHGPPGSHRWWDGSGWTSQVTSAPPTVDAGAPAAAPAAPPAPTWAPATPPPPAAPQPAPSWGPPAGPGPPGAPGAPDWGPAPPGAPPPIPSGRSGRNPLPWIIAAGAGVVLLIAAIVFIASSGDDDTASLSDEATTERPADEDSTDETEPDDEETTDETEPDEDDEESPGAGAEFSIGVLAFPPVGGDWLPFDGLLPEFPGAAGQVQVTQEDAPGDSGSWTANLIIAFLDPTISYAGPQDLEPAARALADKVINGGVYYPEGTTSQIVLAEARQIDGHQAFVMRVELQFSVPGLDATGETVQVAVIDTGVLPASFWGSIPNNVPDLVADMDTAFGSLIVEE